MKKATLAALVLLTLAISFFQVPVQATLGQGSHDSTGPQANALAQDLGPRFNSLWPPQQGPTDPEQADGQEVPPATPTLTPPDEPVLQQPAPPDQADSYESLQQKAQQRDTIRVIVGLDARFSPEGTLSAPAADRQRLDIAQAQQRVLGRVQQGQLRLTKKFRFIPYLN